MGKAVPLPERKLAAVTAYVPLRTRSSVERLARRQRVSIAELTRRAVEHYLAAHGETREGQPDER